MTALLTMMREQDAARRQEDAARREDDRQRRLEETARQEATLQRLSDMQKQQQERFEAQTASTNQLLTLVLTHLGLCPPSASPLPAAKVPLPLPFAAPTTTAAYMQEGEPQPTSSGLQALPSPNTAHTTASQAQTQPQTLSVSTPNTVASVISPIQLTFIHPSATAAPQHLMRGQPHVGSALQPPSPAHPGQH